MNAISKEFSWLSSIWRYCSLVYHSAVKDVRAGHRNAIMGLVLDMIQALTMVVFFCLFIQILGMRSVAVRGNFVLFVMTGVFFYITHIKALGKIKGAADPRNAMLKHAPVTTLMNIGAAALSSLYIAFMSMVIITFLAHVVVEPVTFYNLKIVMLCFFLAWFSGVAVGLLFMGLSIFFPSAMTVVTTAYQRMNMIFSGKMMLASQMPSFMLPMFMWNPLFHTIDQARGATFINYEAKVTSISYVVWVSFTLIVLGFMLEHWGRKYASESWHTRV